MAPETLAVPSQPVRWLLLVLLAILPDFPLFLPRRMHPEPLPVPEKLPLRSGFRPAVSVLLLRSLLPLRIRMDIQYNQTPPVLCGL